jgi:uncharacterized membrane protein
MFGASLYFLSLQAFVLHAFCPFCLLSAALTFFLTGLLLVIPSGVKFRNLGLRPEMQGSDLTKVSDERA